MKLVDWEGFKPSQEVCRTSMLSLHHQTHGVAMLVESKRSEPLRPACKAGIIPI